MLLPDAETIAETRYRPAEYLHHAIDRILADSSWIQFAAPSLAKRNRLLLASSGCFGNATFFKAFKYCRRAAQVAS